MGLYLPRTALWSSNESVIRQQDGGPLTVQGGVDPKMLGFLHQLVKVLEMFSDL